VTLKGKLPPIKCVCRELDGFVCEHIYKMRPTGETDFNINQYYREIWSCNKCGHYTSTTDISLKELYSGEYASMTYGGIKDIEKNFERIMGLDRKKSDNIGRIHCIKEFAENYFSDNNNLEILDIGSGLGVFLAQIKLQTTWSCTSVEPDPNMAMNIRNRLGIEVINKDFRLVNTNKKFDIITLNKVLEHVEDPIDLLSKCKSNLKDGGFIYLEVPDGENASDDKIKFGREEFYLEHFYAFTLKSTEVMVTSAGFDLLKSESLIEPSTKYTIRALLRKIV
jgi:SAM-dependent methyltransferase